LIFHAKDDKLASYTDTKKVISRFPNCTFISFESGGHLLSGHGKEIKKAVSEFISK
jgi:predicted alpha/beta hydrolase family esterase